MNINDFRYVWRGKIQRPLRQEGVHELAPIDQRTPQHDRALLLLHGFSSTPAVYRALLPDLPAYDAIVCPTLPGHGDSIAAFSTIKATDWMSNVQTLAESLAKEYKHLDVMGLSLGGLLACHISQHLPINHLYLLAPALALMLHVPLAIQGARLLHFLGFHSLRNRGGHLCSQDYSELTYRQLPLQTILELLTLVKDFPFKPPTCPTDLFLGRFDDVVDSKRVEQLFLQSSNCHIHWLEHSAHVLPLDNDKDEIIACIRRDFLNPSLEEA